MNKKCQYCDKKHDKKGNFCCKKCKDAQWYLDNKDKKACHYSNL